MKKTTKNGRMTLTVNGVQLVAVTWTNVHGMKKGDILLYADPMDTSYVPVQLAKVTKVSTLAYRGVELYVQFQGEAGRDLFTIEPMMRKRDCYLYYAPMGADLKRVLPKSKRELQKEFKEFAKQSVRSGGPNFKLIDMGEFQDTQEWQIDCNMGGMHFSGEETCMTQNDVIDFMAKYREGK